MTPGWPLVIVDYDPSWPERFEAERARLTHLLRPLRVNVEHIGSTAVPRLASKAIVDVMIGCESLASFQPLIPRLEADDWEYVPRHEAVMPFRRFLGKPRTQPRAFHMHVVETGCDFWHDHLMFRDQLRRDCELMGAYERLKRELAAKHADDRDAYTDAKGPFIRGVIEAAKRAAV